MIRRPSPAALAAAAALAVLLAVVAAAVTTPPSPADRVERIAAQLRCPVCDGESVAQSDSSVSLAIRQEIARLVDQGESEEAILDHFRQQYGDWILNAPPARGWLSAVWLLPAAFLALGGFAAARWLAARSRPPAEPARGAPSAGLPEDAGDDELPPELGEFI